MPQRACAAACQNKCNTCTLNSPQHHHAPHQVFWPQIPPLCFNNLSQNAIPPDDPFAQHAQPGPVEFNGHQYHNLPPELAQGVQNLNAFPSGRGRGHPPLPVYVFYML